MTELFANSRDPDKTPLFAASNLGLHCLPVTRLGVSSFQSVKYDQKVKGMEHLYWESYKIFEH